MAKKKKKKKFSLYYLIAGLALGILALNIILGVIRKPAHLLNPISKLFYKVPSQTWNSYKDVFSSYETDILDAHFLAALAQTESSGNPIATAYWQFSFKQDILSIFQPASSSIGLYQMTYDTFEDAKRFCFLNGEVRADDNRANLKICWKNNFRFRFLVSDSVSLTSARLHYYTQKVLKKYKGAVSKLKQQQLAAIIQLCGPNRASSFIRNGFSVKSMGLCGSHSVPAYVARVFKYKKIFESID
ncbi:MAG: hypothetical protein KDD37_07955 [Bdellovibrionales bacterium]|nr:hypothetical protein [Bdellovibrionales bacterium]